MKAPLSWLKEYVDIDCSPEELEKHLFDSGFEVEEVIKYGDKLNKVVACKILEIEQHKNAERLRVCQVDAGKYGKLQIITNATNVKVGDYCPVAVDGATLANGERIFNGKLRGEDSFGMFCGGEELGITEEYYEGAGQNTVLIFKEEMPVGEEIKDLLELEDYVFDISILANRPDCQSIYGIAREIACKLNKKIKPLAIDFTATNEVDSSISVTVEDKDLCPRYIAHLVKDIKIAPSPKKMARRLYLCGINAINNIVDITNYVLLELGQPMHAFDLDHVDGNKLVIRRAKDGEKIVTLDEKELTLNSNNLVICDQNKPVCLAGIMGGLNSGIRETTNSVLFECAKFVRDNVRKTSRTLGKFSDSSRRFEKGVDEYTTELAYRRALHLICELNAGVVTNTHFDESLGLEQQNKKLVTTFDKINGVLGIEVPKDVIIDILTRLNFEVSVNGNEITTIAPPYREDVENYPDLSEEVIRVYGYEHIVPTLLKEASVTAGGYSEQQKKELQIKKSMTYMGFNEVITYSFYSYKDLDALRLDKDDELLNVIKLQNPISDNYEIMRRTLVPSLLNVVSNNIKKANYEGRIFEIAKTYAPKSFPITDFPNEPKKLCFAIFGDNEDFFTLKGIVENLGNRFGLEFDLNVRNSKNFMHPGVSANILLNGQNIGYFGQVKYEVLSSFDIEKKVYVCEIDYDIFEENARLEKKYSPLPKFAEIKRDLALTVDEKLTNKEIADVIKSACKQYITDVKLFDVYRGAQVGQDKKSMAYTITFYDQEKQLSSEDVDSFVKKILSSLKFRLGIEIRV